MLRDARLIRIRGVVQGVGFRPFAYRLAQRFELGGWVENGGDGVEIHAEGAPQALDAFADALVSETPPAASIASIASQPAPCQELQSFTIRASAASPAPTARIAPDLATCAACLRELFDPHDRRFRYPYINCTDCGPRYSIVRGLPYDRPRTTMAAWPLCERCAAEYHDPADRRFHAQPVACAVCGPTYAFRLGAERGGIRGYDAIAAAAASLRDGLVVAVKGVGGFHLACDATNEGAVAALRERKFRKERPFALMAADLAVAHALIEAEGAVDAVLDSVARPIVLAPARTAVAGVAPDNVELGVMLPYAPLHYLLFAAGAPRALVLTSANRSSEPIAYEDGEALTSLAGIADAFLIGERPIARRLDDSIVRVEAGRVAILRRARGFAPGVVATLPPELTAQRPILALGGDLKNAIALVVGREIVASQHIGDLDHRPAREAYEAAVADLCAMYAVRPEALLVVHDAHPAYESTAFAQERFAGDIVAVQHHRAHVASVLAERGAYDTPVVGVAFDGTGYGDDGTIWGGEVFAGSVRDGFDRIAHLRPARLAGGDAAARFPVQAAAGFLAEFDDAETFARAPFALGERYGAARELLRRDIRCFTTTSVGRLFDTVAALLGFTRAMTFEGQAAMWLEHVATAASASAYPFPLVDGEFDYRPLLTAVVSDRRAGRPVAQIACAFHESVANAVVVAADAYPERPVVCSGGVFQNRLLCAALQRRLGERLWRNAAVPPNDGGIALGQAAIAAFGRGVRSTPT